MHRLGVARQCLLVAAYLTGDAHHRPVGLELRERGLEHLPRPLAADLPDQVDGHVVRRAEAGPKRIGAGRGEPGESCRVEAGLPQHHGVALDVDPTPTGATGQLGELSGCDVGVRLAVPLAQLLEDHRTCRHVDAQSEGLGGEDGLDQPVDEQVLHHLLERGQHAGVVGGHTALQALQPFVVAQHREVLVGDVDATRRDEGPDLVALPWAEQAHPGTHALRDCGVAAGPAEDEGDRREQALGVEALDDLHPAGRVDPARALTPSAGSPVADPPPAHLLAGQPDQLGVHRLVSVVDEQVVETVSGHHVLPQRHGSVLLDDDDGVAADRHEPVAELLGVADRRRQRDEPHRLVEVDDDLFPDRAAEPVGQVVHLVHHDVAESAQGR